MPPTILLNSLPTTQIPADNRGLHYGDGIFETLLCQQGRPSFWPQHWDRLKKGAQRLELTLKPEAYYLNTIAQASSQAEWAVVKLTLIRSGITRGYRPLPAAPSLDIVYAYETSDQALQFQQVVTLCVCKTQLPEDHNLAGIKHLNRLHQVMAAAECVKAGCEDGIVLDNTQTLVETTCANILFLKDNVLHTPQCEHAGIAGVGVAVVTRAWREQGGQHLSGQYSLQDLAAASAVMTVNSVRGVRPVERIWFGQLTPTEWPNAATDASVLQNLFFTELKRSWQDGYAN